MERSLPSTLPQVSAGSAPPGASTVDVCLTTAALHARCGRLAYASALLDYGLSVSPDEPRLLRLSAHVLVELSRPQDALQRLARLEMLEGGDPRTTPRDVLTARALLAAGHAADAKAYFRRHIRSRQRRHDGGSAR